MASNKPMATATRIPFKPDPDGRGFEMENPATGKREYWTQLVREQARGRVEVNLIGYMDMLVTENDGLALYAEQIAEIHKLGKVSVDAQLPDEHAKEAAQILRTMLVSTKDIGKLRAWYERDVELGNRHLYPPSDGT